MINTKRLVFSLFVLLITAQVALGQAVIKGTVTDAETGKALQGVNVYLAETTYGASTNETGYYKISVSKPGTYNLVVSLLGYKKKLFRVGLAPSLSQTLNVELKAEVQQLDEIVVKSSNEKWMNQYQYFFKKFIGHTEFADKVTIDNRWVLEFREEKEMLLASTQRPLKITNNSLGYEIYAELADFRWPSNSHRDRGGTYVIYPRYQLLDVKSDQQHLQWKKNRLKSYLGSLQHFLKSLYHNTLDESGFSIDQKFNLVKLTKEESRSHLKSMPRFSHRSGDKVKGYKLEGFLQVEYDGSADFELGEQSYSVSVEKEGGIHANTREHIFFVDKYGSLLNPLSVAVFAQWADKRIAQALPVNYTIGD